MRLVTGLLVLATCAPYFVYGDSLSAASAAAVSEDGSVAVASSAASSSNEPFYRPPPAVECNCIQVYDPVCASDGLTYSNACIVGCINRDNRRSRRSEIELLHKGPCKTLPCDCTTDYYPVCGKNNHTYINECWLNCTNTKRINDGLYPIPVSYKGACTQPACVCTDTIVPVCGTDGRTYRNICVMQCASRMSETQGKDPIRFRSNGACPIENCPCTNEPDYLCASDDNSYTNDCMFDCHNRRRNQLGLDALTFQYRGRCIRCPCTKEYAPVCAKNEVTFDNYCHYLCENDKRIAAKLPELLLRWKGKCNCDCNNDYKPVCASNLRTYQNRCALRCDNRKRYQDYKNLWTEISVGQCKPCNCEWCRFQPEKPVCSTDDDTYYNACYLNCNSDCRAAYKLPRIYIAKYSRCPA